MAQNIDILLKAQDDASASIKKVNLEITNLKKWVWEAWKSVSTFWDTFKALAAFDIAKKIWWQVFEVWKSIIWLTSNLQQATISFTTMLWSADKAQKLLTDLSDFAKKTPFELTWIRENAKQLLAMWVAQENILPTLKMLWDVSSWLSVPLERLWLAYWQVLAKGRLMWDDLRQFTEAWVPLLKVLWEQLWKTTWEISKMIEKWQISAVEVTKAFQTMSSEWWQFANMMEKQSTTMQWMWSNVQDSLAQLWEKIWNKLIPTITSAIATILEFINKNWEAIASFVSDTVALIIWFFGTLKDLAIVVKEVFGTVYDAIYTAGEYLWLFWWKIDEASQLVKISEWTVYDYKKAIEALAKTKYNANTEEYIKERNEIIKNINATITLLKAKRALWIVAKQEAEKSKVITWVWSTAPEKTWQWLMNKLELDLTWIKWINTALNKEKIKFNESMDSAFWDQWLNKQIKDAEDSIKNIDKLISDVQKWSQIDLSKIWWWSWWASWTKKTWKSEAETDREKAMNYLKQLSKDTAQAFESAFSSIDWKVKSQKDKVIWLKEDYTKLKDELKKVWDEWAKALQEIQEKLDKQVLTVNWIKAEWQTDIAKRLIEAKDELEKIRNDRLNWWMMTGEELEKSMKRELDLRNEINLWEANTTVAERNNALIESQKSQTQLILDRIKVKLAEAETDRVEIQKTYDVKKKSIEDEQAKITAQMLVKKQEIQAEFDLYQSLILQRKDLDSKYFQLFQKNISDQIDKTKQAIELMNQLNAKTWWPTATTSSSPEVFTSKQTSYSWSSWWLNVSINMWWVAVNNWQDVNSIANTIIDKITRSVQLQKLGIS